MRHRGFVAVSTAGSHKNKRSLTPALQVTIGTAQRCPFCHEHLQGGADDDALVACAECLTVSHEECVAEGGGGCTTLGCAHSRPEAIARAAAASTPTPVLTQAPARASRVLLGVVGALLLLGLGGGGLVLALMPVPHVPPPPMHVVPPRISSFDVHVRGDVLVVRARGGVLRTYESSLGQPEARVNGVTVPLSITGSVNSDLVWGIDAELPLAQVVGDRPGAHPVELRFSAWGMETAAQRVVQVERPRVEVPPVREVIVVEPREVVVAEGPRLTLDTPVVRTNQTEVEVSGFVHSDGPVQVTVGDLTLRLLPGRFTTTVTVGPRPGTYPIGVRVRDARGRLVTAEQRVEFVGDGR